MKSVSRNDCMYCIVMITIIWCGICFDKIDSFVLYISLIYNVEKACLYVYIGVYVENQTILSIQLIYSYSHLIIYLQVSYFYSQNGGYKRYYFPNKRFCKNKNPAPNGEDVTQDACVFNILYLPLYHMLNTYWLSLL